MAAQAPVQVATGTMLDVQAEKKRTTQGEGWLYTAIVQFDGENQQRKLKTWKEEIAQVAFAGKGQHGTIKYTIKPAADPQYAPDLMLSGFEVGAGLPGASSPVAADTPPAFGAQVADTPPAFGGPQQAAGAPVNPVQTAAPPAGIPETSDDRQPSIRRGGVAKAAAILFRSGLTLPHSEFEPTWAHYMEIFKLVDELVETGESVPF